jgi:hypothetical protein
LWGDCSVKKQPVSHPGCYEPSANLQLNEDRGLPSLQAIPHNRQSMNCNYRAETLVLNVGRFADSGMGRNVTKF